MTMEDLRIKLIYTAVVYFLFLQLALRYGICGPTLSDLKDNLGVSTEDVSNSVSLMCVGICVGAICSGFVCKFFSREFLCFVLVLTTAILVASITFLTQFSLFLVWNLLVGITSGASISICESWILQIWGSQCGPYMQALQFFRGLGYIIAPVLANPFLVSNGGIGLKEEELPNATLATLSEWYNQTNTPIHSTSYNTKIRTPYLLNAIMLAVGAIFLLCLYIYKRFSLSKDKPSKAISQIEILSNSALSLADSKCVQSVVLADKKGDGQSVVMNRRAKYFGYAIVLLSSVFYLFFYEEVIVIFLPTFASKLNLRLSKSEASMLTTAFSLCNVIGKAVGVLLALKISYMLILYLNLFIMIGSLVVIILFANTSVTVLWIGVCLHGIGLSSTIGCLYTLMEGTVQMSASTCGLLNMMGTVGSVVMPLAIGPHLDTFPMCLIYACLVCALLCLALYLAMHILLRNKNKLISVKVLPEKDKSQTSQQKHL